jgi:hypothetical protein
MQRWDFGLGAILGYELTNGISIYSSYQIGLINMISAEKDNMIMKNRTIGLGVGFKF